MLRVTRRRWGLPIVVTAAAVALMLVTAAAALSAPPLRGPSGSVTPPVVMAADAFGEQPAPSTGSLLSIALLVDFPDFAHQTSATFFNDLIFGDRNDLLSVRDYYREVSYGLLDVATLNLPSTLGWLTVSQSKMYYIGDGGGYGTYPRNRERMVEEALALADHLVDFSRYDCNGDGFVDNLMIVCAGRRGNYLSCDFQPQVTRLTHPVALDGVLARRFTILPELAVVPGDLKIGLYVHEMGHILGLPDLYPETDCNSGVGVWSLMSSGLYAGVEELPTRLDAWSSARLGWLQPQTITGPPTLLTIPWVGSSRTAAFKLYPHGTTGGPEYFLVENRQRVGTDIGLPGSGLLIWHIDETRSIETLGGAQSVTAHKLVDLEEAGGFQHLDVEPGLVGSNCGSDDDPFPGSTGNREFGDSTTPNAKTYDGTDSDVVVYQISDSGMVMTAVVGIGEPPAEPTFPDVSVSHPYYTAIHGMASRWIIGGYTDGRFGPEDLVMRQQFAKMIVGTLGLDVVEEEWQDTNRPFQDLGLDDLSDLYPHEYVAVCARNNITKGTKDPTKFAPYENVTRAQVITMVVRAADNLKPGTLQPVPQGWTGVLSASDATHGANIAKAERNSLLAGIRGPGGTLGGWDTYGKATRGEVAQILWNLLRLVD